MIGIYSMFVKLKANDEDRFATISQAFFRIITFVGFIIFIGFFANSEFIVLFFLGDTYKLGIGWMKFLSLCYIPLSIIDFLLIRFLATGSRFDVMIIRGGGLITRIILAIILIPFHIYGLLFAILISALFTVISFIVRSPEIISWSKNQILRFFGFLLLNLPIILVLDYLLIWPLNNIIFGLILLNLIIIKPFETSDMQYIERVIPRRFQFIMKPLLDRISRS
jgi:O-antigen/teichoic acid export membrane protein